MNADNPLEQMRQRRYEHHAEDLLHDLEFAAHCDLEELVGVLRAALYLAEQKLAPKELR
jgi:hypothetical protein